MVLRDTSVKTKLFSNGVCLRKFSRMKSGRPEPNVQHFFEKPVEETLVGVVVPIYNEQAIDLRKTLLAIDMQANYMKTQKMPITPHVMLVQDGVSKASESVKKYLRNMFNLDENQWKREFEMEDNSAPYQTFILQILNNSRVSYVNINAGYKANTPVNMLVTLIIKKDNRKKHNSHEWFLGESGFVNYYRPKYALCTDCSTLFHKACLMKLVQYMEANPTCSVSTGRQRVMTKEMQGDPDESSFSVASVLRHAQRFDYESSFVCYTGTFSAAGFLPVVPGPCGLYRTETLIPSKENGGYEGSPCEWYFDVVNTDPDQSGLVLGNLRIAEDRVLSYSVVLKARTPSVMGLVPQAVFYFEAETKLKSLMLQRRRWINGTWAGYWYLSVQHPDLIFKCTQINILTKLFIWFLLLCQMATYFIVALAPSIFLGALRLSLSNLAVDVDTTLAMAAWGVLVVMYLYFVYHHHNNVYLGWLFNIWLLFSAVLSISSITSFVIYIVNNHHLLHYNNIAMGNFHNEDFCDSLTIYLVIAMLVLPLIMSIIADGTKSFILMLRSIVPYYAILPMMVGFFSAYSFSRCWDLTWGNRPSEADPAHQQAQAKMDELKTQSATLAAFIAIVNIFFFFVQELILTWTGGKLYMAMVIFSTALVQMLIGFFWFSLWRIKYFFQQLWFFIRHCRGMKKFKYDNYGHEEDDSSDSDGVYTLYYDDNNDSDSDDVADFIDDGDAVEDYYDTDSKAIVLVDGPLQRHMSVSNLAISYPTLPPVPEGKEVKNDGAGTVPNSPMPQAFMSVPTSPVIRASNSSILRSPLTRGARTALANSVAAPNRVPIITTPALRQRYNNNNNNNDIEDMENSSHIMVRRSSVLGPRVSSPMVDNRPRLAYSFNTSSSNVSFANPPAVVIPAEASNPERRGSVSAAVANSPQQTPSALRQSEGNAHL